MIKFVKHDEIDYSKWDACIDNAVNKIIYAYSWYLDAICEEWHALIEDDYVSVLPLPTRKKIIFRYTFQPFFAQQLGVFSQKLLYVDKVQNMLSEIPLSYSIIDIKLNQQCPFDYQRYVSKKNINVILDLNKDYDSLVGNYSSNTIRNIEDAHDKSLSITEKVEPKEIIDLFRKNKGQKVKALKDENYATLLNLMNILIEKGKAILLGVEDKDKNLLTAAFFIKHPNRFIFLFSGNSEKGRECKSMFFLIDSFIEKHANSGYLLDFEGSNDKGLTRFYAGFGGRKTAYYTYLVNRLIFPFNLFYAIYRNNS